MNFLILVLFCILFLFAGFAIGRMGDKYRNGEYLATKKTPHHWIYGLSLIVVGVVFYHNFWAFPLFFFATGIFISDLNDFLNFRIYGVDVPHKWKFWSIK